MINPSPVGAQSIEALSLLWVRSFGGVSPSLLLQGSFPVDVLLAPTSDTYNDLQPSLSELRPDKRLTSARSSRALPLEALSL